MTTYQVIAENCGFYQTLRVDADNESSAATAFRAYLSSDQNKNWEQYEYECQNENYPHHPDDFIYGFDDRDIEEIEDAPRAYRQVDIFSSGGIGALLEGVVNG